MSRKRKAFRAIGIVTMLVGVSAIAIPRANAAPTAPPIAEPRYRFVTEVCETYEDGSGVCGIAHRAFDPLVPDAYAWVWVFDSISERHCLKHYPCAETPPIQWGER